jgi:UDP-glucose 4-epimerase
LDDFSSGKKSNLPLRNPKLRAIEIELSDKVNAAACFSNQDLVFHLAAVHGGRGFIEKYPQKTLTNLVLDHNVFALSVANHVQRVVHASSACAYPIHLQEDAKSLLKLSELELGSMDSPGCTPDGTYGWTKLIGEYQLAKLVASTSTTGRSARIFTAYGERENESHAAIALIAKALLKMDPYPIWGSGLQTRNFTYVADTVRGLLHLGADSRPMSFDVVNVGTSDHIPVLDFIETIFEIIGWHPNEIAKDLSKPQGVASRAADNTYIRKIFGWEPRVSISEGLSRTIEWYSQLEDRPKSIAALEELLESR